MGTIWESLKTWCHIWGLVCSWDDQFFTVHLAGKKYVIERKVYDKSEALMHVKYLLYEDGGFVMSATSFLPLMQYIMSKNPSFFSGTPRYFRHLRGDGDGDRLRHFPIYLPREIYKFLESMVAFGLACNISEAARILMSIGAEELAKRAPCLAKVNESNVDGDSDSKNDIKVFSMKIPQRLLSLLEKAEKMGLGKSKAEIVRLALVEFLTKRGLMRGC